MRVVEKIARGRQAEVVRGPWGRGQGACPGPITALGGSGVWVLSAVLVSVLLGTCLYAVVRSHLPH